jgi:DNA-directed RNA polymerase II subunit RPB3
MDIETVGSMPPDEIMQQGIKYLQEKLAAVIKTFREEGDDSGVRSPGQADYAMGGMGGGGGYETPYGAGGVADGRTPYGAGSGFGQATPYGAGNGGWQ